METKNVFEGRFKKPLKINCEDHTEEFCEVKDIEKKHHSKIIFTLILLIMNLNFIMKLLKSKLIQFQHPKFEFYSNISKNKTYW